MRYLYLARTCFVAVATLCTGIASSAQTPTLAVDVSSGRYPISPYIYGVANYDLDPAFAREINISTVRWGGDGTSRYNWEVDSTNAGFDWYFMGGSGTANPVPGAGPDTMIATYPTAGALITIPILPYVNKSSAWNCSFPTSVYGAQQSTNPYVFPTGPNGQQETCGNSIASNGSQLLDTDIYANHIDNSPSLQESWLQHLVAAHGTAAHGGVPFYQLDNEPYGWSNTHRDVEPTQPDYPTITQLGEQYAAVIKQADPSAMVLGPSDFTLGGWVGDTTKQNGLLAAQYYLQQMAAYEQQNGVRILDSLDEHYYPQFSDEASQLAATRTLWDPTYNGGTWVEQYVFDGPMQLLPRMQQWVSQYYPGTKISISEYSIDSGKGTIVDALAEMDMLGIFGREQLLLAEMWYPPTPTYPIAYAFRMFRNYDGNGSEYGDTWINATSTNQANLSIYASQRSTDNVVTIMVLNKTTGAINTSLALTGATLPAAASVYTYSGSNLGAIVSGPSAAIANGSISYNFPAYSATLFTFAPAAALLASTTTTLSASASSVTAGQSVAFTATVTGTASPTGTVSFKDGGNSIGTGTLSNGQVSWPTSTLAVGTHSVTAVYSGDANNAASTSTAVNITVTAAAPVQIATTTSLSASSTQITSGQSVTFNAAVAGTSPTGIVTFYDGSNPISSASLSGSIAFYTATNLGVGTHAITAVYSGDANNAPSTSSAVSVIVSQSATVPPAAPTPAATATSLTAAATQITTGQSVTLTTRVTAPADTPTGTVTFNSGATVLGTATLVAGTATFNFKGASAGSYAIIASYGGDANDSPSTSAPVAIVVEEPAGPPAAAPGFGLALTQTAITVAPGSTGQVGVSINPQNGFSSVVELTCSGLPAGATCSFSPASLTPGSSDTSSMTILTTPTTSLFGILFLSPLLGTFFPQKKRRLKSVLLVAFGILLMASGCGVSVHQGGSSGTPAGTYNVIVSATTAGGQSQSQQLTLTVKSN